MRGKTLLQESTGSSVCAFCAHRLRRYRNPSHIQRRFLKTTRPFSNPPGEAVAVREDHGNGRSESQPSWGQAASGNRTQIPAGPSWGGIGMGAARGGISSAPSAAFGVMPSTHGNETPQAQSGSVQKENPSEDLLPHERLARARIQEQAANANIRPIKINAGPGPQSTRAGRPFVFERRTAEEEQELARREAARERARAAPRRPLVRSTYVDEKSASQTSHQELKGWNQLKEASDKAAQERKRVEDAAKQTSRASMRPVDRLTVGRAQREEQARSGSYTSLDRRNPVRVHSPENPSFLRRQEKPVADFPPRNPLDTSFGRNQYASRNVPDNSVYHKRMAKDGAMGDRSQAEQSQKRDAETTLSPAKQSAKDSTGHKSDSIVSWSPISKNSPRGAELDDRRATIRFSAGNKEESYSRPSRASKPSNFRATAQEPEPNYSKQLRGKDRDKAKRRDKFLFDNEDALEAREEARERAEAKKQRKREKAVKKRVPIMLPDYISVSNLAIALHVRIEDFVIKMQELGFEETNHDFILNSENAGLIAMEYNYDPIIDRGDLEDLKPREPAADPSILPSRPPVVTIMGHVDHGKTTILDYLRKSSVAASEHGGITQHIGAFSVPMPSGKTVTFLDTPGHAAFLNMRQRGAVVTDIVILVVAADDSVKPQTIEAIKHAKDAKVPIMVAINKVDKDEANIDRVKQDLARHSVDIEDFGGDVQVVCVSGKTGQGMNDLEENVMALSEILDKRAEVDGPIEGWVLEASVKSMGKVATILVRRGTLRPGDFIVAGKTWARVRCMRNEAGLEVESAGPGIPVEIDGWRDQPEAGDEVLEAPNAQKAQRVVDLRLEKEERNKMAEDMEAINESRKSESDRRAFEKAQAEAEQKGEEFNIPKQEEGGAKLVYFIVKGDVSGSVEAVTDSIAHLGNKEVQPHVLRSAVGQVSEFDIEHAAAAKGCVISFNTEVEQHITTSAERAGVRIIDHNIIYRLTDDVKAELSKHLPPLVTQRVLGEAEILKVFEITVKGRQVKNVAGCRVKNGVIARNAKIRVLRDGEKIFTGTLASLKNAKKDISESNKGSECGMSFTDWTDFLVGDQIQAYDEKEEKRYL